MNDRELLAIAKRVFSGPDAYPPLTGEPLNAHPELMRDFEKIAREVCQRLGDDPLAGIQRLMGIDIPRREGVPAGQLYRVEAFVTVADAEALAKIATEATVDPGTPTEETLRSMLFDHVIPREHGFDVIESKVVAMFQKGQH